MGDTSVKINLEVNGGEALSQLRNHLESITSLTALNRQQQKEFIADQTKAAREPLPIETLLTDRILAAKSNIDILKEAWNDSKKISQPLGSGISLVSADPALGKMVQYSTQAILSSVESLELFNQKAKAIVRTKLYELEKSEDSLAPEELLGKIAEVRQKYAQTPDAFGADKKALALFLSDLEFKFRDYEENKLPGDGRSTSTITNSEDGNRKVESSSQRIASPVTLQPSGFNSLPTPGIQTVGMQHANELQSPNAPTSGQQNQMATATATLQSWGPLVQSLQSGFSAINTDFASWSQRIIGTRSVFQQFVSGVIEGLVKIGEQLAEDAAIAGILTLITGGAGGGFSGIFSALSGMHFADGGVIGEPVVGFGTQTGRSYLMGEAGPERISPLTSFNSGGGGRMVVEVRGQSVVRGQDLYHAWTQAQIHDNKL